jgi:hypothetical protein
MADTSSDRAVKKQIKALEAELAKLKSWKGGPAPDPVKDAYRLNITVKPGAKPKVDIDPLTVNTLSCATACGTCMIDSCYTC